MSNYVIQSERDGKWKDIHSANTFPLAERWMDRLLRVPEDPRGDWRRVHVRILLRQDTVVTEKAVYHEG